MWPKMVPSKRAYSTRWLGAKVSEMHAWFDTEAMETWCWTCESTSLRSTKDQSCYSWLTSLVESNSISSITGKDMGINWEEEKLACPISYSFLHFLPSYVSLLPICSKSYLTFAPTIHSQGFATFHVHHMLLNYDYPHLLKKNTI